LEESQNQTSHLFSTELHKNNLASNNESKEQSQKMSLLYP